MLPEGFKLTNESIFERDLPKLVLHAVETGDSDELFELVCTDERAAVEWVCLGESFTRPSKMFKQMTSLQLKFSKDERYAQYFRNMISVAEEHKTKWAKVMYPDLYEIYEGIF